LAGVLRVVGAGPYGGNIVGANDARGQLGVPGRLGGCDQFPPVLARLHKAVGAGHRESRSSKAIRVPRTGPGRPRVRPSHVLGDKGYSSRAIRIWLRRRGISPTIPERADQVRSRLNRGSRGGRPPSFDRDTDKRRNVVERCFNKLKQWRGIATRYDKTTESYQAAVTLAALLMWA
jgi:transposase